MSKTLKKGLLMPTILHKAWSAPGSRGNSQFVKSMLNEVRDTNSSPQYSFSTIMGQRLEISARQAYLDFNSLSTKVPQMKKAIVRTLQEKELKARYLSPDQLGRFMLLAKIHNEISGNGLQDFGGGGASMVEEAFFKLDRIPTVEEVIESISYSSAKKAAQSFRNTKDLVKQDFRRKVSLGGLKDIDAIVKAATREMLVETKLGEAVIPDIPRKFVSRAATQFSPGLELIKEHPNLDLQSNRGWGDFDSFYEKYEQTAFTKRAKESGISGPAYFYSENGSIVKVSPVSIRDFWSV